ncbi:hypothetical protein [Usitatibacter rugosus]|uniref:hypothetical protein n=1 Tax=Usitatibacter rugosus TaxID=2732067 RepID=UPI001487E859|nr:hypothetical protein [Usitatibacter rugosus]
MTIINKHPISEESDTMNLTTDPLPAEVVAAARRAGFIVRPSAVPDCFDLYREDGTVSAACVSRESVETAARAW